MKTKSQLREEAKKEIYDILLELQEGVLGISIDEATDRIESQLSKAIDTALEETKVEKVKFDNSALEVVWATTHGVSEPEAAFLLTKGSEKTVAEQESKRKEFMEGGDKENE